MEKLQKLWNTGRFLRGSKSKKSDSQFQEPPGLTLGRIRYVIRELDKSFKNNRYRELADQIYKRNVLEKSVRAFVGRYVGSMIEKKKERKKNHERTKQSFPEKDESHKTEYTFFFIRTMIFGSAWFVLKFSAIFRLKSS